jgi:dTDP-4-amino-4,6-dideoxygalactose transaminase
MTGVVAGAIPMYSAERVDAAVDVVRSIARVVDSHRYVLGPEVAAFESAFADYCGVAQCVGVANGTDALEIALRAVDVGPSDRVVVVANAGFYGSTAIHGIGALPHYVEIDRDTLTMSAAALEEALASRPSAVVVTHLYGRLAAIEPIVAAATGAGIPVIEDCAQAHGAARSGARAGSFGTLGCFSFYPTKNLPAVGDGGALVTSDSALAERIRRLRQYGWGAKYQVETKGGRNSRLDEVQAAVLNDRLPWLETWNEERRSIAQRYVRGLAGMPVDLPPSFGSDSVAHLFVLGVDDRNVFRDDLREAGVATDVHYPVADHLQPAYATEQAHLSLPVTERACRRVVSLPCYPGMSDAQIGTVIDAIGRRFAKAEK